jgi:hypothetical protein
MRETTTDLLTRIETMERELRRLKNSVTCPSVQGEAGEPSVEASEGVDLSASRRDLLRYGAVALGAVAAGMAASPVEAADGGPVVIGAYNSGTGTTQVHSQNAYGLWGTSAASGAAGIGGASPFAGVYGSTDSLTGVAVYGSVLARSGTPEAVRGLVSAANGVGVRGINAGGGNAVRAEVPAYSSSNAIAMYALNYSTYTGSVAGAGGFAIYGLSANGHGLVGATAAAGASAVVGASNGVAGAYAAAFYGPTVVSGNFTVVGGAKSAAVPHPDGSHRRLYCVESPESWFEDFGRGTLVCGEARVPLDRDFAGVVDATDYHVFVTGHDGRFDLSVSDQTADGFRVCASGSAEGTFSWRVVAKRRDIPAPRFEKVEIPAEPTLPAVPASALEEPKPMSPSLAGGKSIAR